MPPGVNHNNTFPDRDSLRLLQEGAVALGVPLPPEAGPRFQMYLQELKTWNARVNLTGLKSDREIVIKGFLDSLAVLPFLHDAPTLADLGSGAGFPGLVLKLARPEMTLTLVESRGKKAAFLEYLAALLGLSGVEVVQARLTPRLAQEWGPRFAAVTSRAAFSLEGFLKLAAPVLLPGGRALAFKGAAAPLPEIEAARRVLAALDLGNLDLQEYRVPFSEETRTVVVAQKSL